MLAQQNAGAQGLAQVVFKDSGKIAHVRPPLFYRISGPRKRWENPKRPPFGIKIALVAT
jgi:hypothetical protein